MPEGIVASAQLTKLATELELLLRAGSPLGCGLRDAAMRWRGPLRQAAEKLALRLESGVPADEALRSSSELPTVFRSLAAAGLATNRAADILQAYATSTRQLLELKERLFRGMMYPAIILLLAYLLLLVVVATVLPEMASMLSDFSGPPPAWTPYAHRARETLPIWSWAFPVLLLTVVTLFHAFVGNRISAIGWWGGFPIARQIVSDIYTSSASRLLAALLECEVPLPLALSLSSESLSSRSSRVVVSAIADNIRNGVPASHAFRSRNGAPPLWRALFASSSEPVIIQAGLSHISEILAERARGRADFLGRVVPIVLVVVLGGLAVMAYASLVFGPLIQIWDRLGGQT